MLSKIITYPKTLTILRPRIITASRGIAVPRPRMVTDSRGIAVSISRVVTDTRGIAVSISRVVTDTRGIAVSISRISYWSLFDGEQTIYTMLYGTQGGGCGRKSKYTVLPRGGRVQFDFWNSPAGWPSTVLFFKLSCWAAESNWQAGQGRSIRRPDEAAVGGRGRTVYFAGGPREDRIFWFLAKSPSLSSIWIVYTDEPLMVFSGPIVKVGRFCKSKVEKSTVESNGGQPTA